MNFGKSLKDYFKRKLNERITLMIIPHNEAKIINIQLSKLALAFTFIVLFLVLVISYIAWLRDYSIKPQMQELHSADKAVEKIQNMFLSRYYDFKNIHSGFETNLIGIVQEHHLASIPQLFNESEKFYQKAAKQQIKEERIKFLETQETSLSNVISSNITTSSTQKINEDFRFSEEVIAYRSLAINLKQSEEVISSLNKLFEVRIKAQKNLPTTWPTRGGHFTSLYGARHHPIMKRTEFHFGLDIANSPGTPIYAAANGKVVMAGYSTGGYGNRIKITHGFGYSSVYAHMQSLAVSYGEYVHAGQLIGRMGSTGRSSGPHLHFEVRLNDKHLDPLPFINKI